MHRFFMKNLGHAIKAYNHSCELQTPNPKRQTDIVFHTII